MKKLIFILIILSIFHERKAIIDWVNSSESSDLELELKIQEAAFYVDLWKAEVESDENDLAYSIIKFEDTKYHLDKIEPLYKNGSISDKEYRNVLLEHRQSAAELTTSKIELKKSQAMLKIKEVDLELAQIGSWSFNLTLFRQSKIK